METIKAAQNVAYKKSFPISYKEYAIVYVCPSHITANGVYNGYCVAAGAIIDVSSYYIGAYTNVGNNIMLVAFAIGY